MEYGYLGKSGLKVSRLCLGTINFGNHTDEKEAFKIMDAAVANGINYIETAESFGIGAPGYTPVDGAHAGWTEEIIGRWFKAGEGRRDKVILGTMTGSATGKEGDPNDAKGTMSAYKLRRRLEGSLKRLQTDHVEIYSMQGFDNHTTWEEMWGAYESLISQGKVDYAGASNFTAPQLHAAQAAAEKRNFVGLVAEQHRCCLMDRDPMFSVFPSALSLGIGLNIYSPLHSGLLSDTMLGETVPETSRSKKYFGRLNDKYIAMLHEFEDMCHEIGETQATVSLAWLLSYPAVSTVIIGPRTVEQLESCVRAAELKLDPEFLTRLEKKFPLGTRF